MWDTLSVFLSASLMHSLLHIVNQKVKNEKLCSRKEPNKAINLSKRKLGLSLSQI